MIDASELKLGNWVLVNGAERLIFSIAPPLNGSTYGFNLFEGEMPSFYDNECEPIPLTPELLERCGFEKNGDWYVLKTFTLSPQTISISIVHNKSTFGNNEDYEIKHIKYLHETQNLYFSLTGEELEIKELQHA